MRLSLCFHFLGDLQLQSGGFAFRLLVLERLRQVGFLLVCHCFCDGLAVLVRTAVQVIKRRLLLRDRL
ncbi:hypothetical protein D3C87_2148380 [compost metagenome]